MRRVHPPVGVHLQIMLDNDASSLRSSPDEHPGACHAPADLDRLRAMHSDEFERRLPCRDASRVRPCLACGRQNA